MQPQIMICNKNLYIYCSGGFGNRFHCLVSGLHICKNSNLTPIIVWPSQNSCRLKFKDIFENKFKVLEEVPANIERSFLISHLPLSKNYIDVNTFTKFQDIQDSFNNTNSSFLVYMCCRIDKIEGLDYSVIRELQFHEYYLNKVKNLTQNLEFTGVHLRSTDFPFRDFNDLYLEIQNSEKNFFVCSDNQVLESKFNQLKNVFIFEKESYPQKIDSQKDWNIKLKDKFNLPTKRNIERSSASVKDAIIDLLVLSKAKTLHTNVFTNSTFYTSAKMISKSYNEN